LTAASEYRKTLLLYLLTGIPSSFHRRTVASPTLKCRAIWAVVASGSASSGVKVFIVLDTSTDFRPTQEQICFVCLINTVLIHPVLDCETLRLWQVSRKNVNRSKLLEALTQKERQPVTIDALHALACLTKPMP
jgi:hypothetical protein